MWQISRIIGMGFLIGLAVEDIKFRMISEQLLLMAAVLGVGYQVCTKEISELSLLGGIGIGLMFLLISYVTREAIGYGDSLLICILGAFVGIAELIEILMAALLLAAAAAIGLLTCKRFSRTMLLPFVPFLTVGYGYTSISVYLTEYCGRL